MKEIKGILTFWCGLSFWQKVLLFSCFLPVVAFFFISSGRENLVALAPSGSPKELQKHLKSYGIDGKIDGNSLWIPQSQKNIALSLSKKDKDQSYEKLAIEGSIFEPRWKSRLKAKVSLERKLQEMLCSIPSIKKALVHLTLPVKTPFSTNSGKGKAAVTVYLSENRNRLSCEEVQAIAYMVSSSVTDLNPEEVAILAKGRYYSIQNLTESDKILSLEDHYQRKITEALSSLSIKNVTLSLEAPSPSPSRGVLEARIILVMNQFSPEKKKFYHHLLSGLLSPMKIKSLQIFAEPTRTPKEKSFRLSLSPYLIWGVLGIAALLLMLHYFPWHLSNWEKDLDREKKLWVKIRSFDDLHLLSDKILSDGLLEVDKERLCLAMKVASPKIKKKILKNLPPSDQKWLKEEMECLGPVRLNNVEGAQQEIWSAIQRVWKR